MGGTPSKPPPVVNVAPYPGSGDNITGFSPDKQTAGCKGCSISIPPGVSTSSVRLTRGAADEGAITGAQCAELYTDIEKLREAKMSILDFKAKLRRGRYFRATDNPAYCEQLKLPPEISYKITDYKSVVDNLRSLQGVRSFFVTDSGFSASSKVTITPNIPFRIKINGTDVTVPKMTIFHPSPVRIGNIQHDAVLTLNDPADERATHVVLIPIKSDAFGERKATFFGNFAPYIAGLLEPDPEYGEFDPVDVPTGSTWNLTSLLPVQPNAQTKESDVVGGFYVWEGMPSYQLVLKSQTKTMVFYDKYYQPQDIYTYGWEPTTKSPMYLVMETPVPISPTDLMAIRRLPVTPADQALHPIKPDYLYKPGPPSPEDCNKVADAPPDATGLFARETFESGDAADVDKRCDPYEIAKAANTAKGITRDKVIEAVLWVFGAIAAFIGIYFAIKWASTDSGNYFKRIGEYIGKVFGGAQRLAKAAIAKQKQALSKQAEPETETKAEPETETKAEPEKPEPETEAKPETDETRLASALEKENPLRQAIEGKEVDTMGAQVSKTTEQGRRATARRGLASYKPSRRVTQRRGRVPAEKEQETKAIEEKPLTEREQEAASEFQLTPEEEKKAVEEMPMTEREQEAKALRESQPASTGLLTSAEMKEGETERKALQRMYEEQIADLQRQETNFKRFEQIKKIEDEMRKEGLTPPKREIKRRKIAFEDPDSDIAEKLARFDEEQKTRIPIAQRFKKAPTLEEAQERLRKSEEGLRAVQRPRGQTQYTAEDVIKGRLPGEQTSRLAYAPGLEDARERLRKSEEKLRGRGKRRNRRRTVH
jgi:hypothetical protein